MKCGILNAVLVYFWLLREQNNRNTHKNSRAENTAVYHGSSIARFPWGRRSVCVVCLIKCQGMADDKTRSSAPQYSLGYSGTSTCVRISCRMRSLSSVLLCDIAARVFTIMRCANTGRASRFTSSGMI